jgi:hypothetical protein
MAGRQSSLRARRSAHFGGGIVAWAALSSLQLLIFLSTNGKVAAAPTPSPTTDRYPFWNNLQHCVDRLVLSDENRDNQLDEGEYIRFIIGSTTGSSDTPVVDGVELPDLLIGTFWNELLPQGSTSIDISGAKSDLNRTSEEQEQLEKVCYATGKAIFQSLYDRWAPPRPPTQSPSPTLTPSLTHPPFYTSPSTDNLPYWSDYLHCLIGLAVGDGDRNDRLDERSEYLHFIGFALGLSIGDFSDLPDLLQQNYWDLASLDTGMIDVAGSKPGQSQTAEQKAHLENICYATGKAISQALKDGLFPGAIPTPSPVLVATSTPSPLAVWSFTQCTTTMLLSDLDRNDRMDTSEYVRFVNRGANNQWGSSSFEDLPRLLQDKFWALENLGEGIDIWGSKPGQDPTDEQKAHLENMCHVTGRAISQALEDDSFPGAIPTPSPILPTLQPMYVWSFTQCTTAMTVSDLNRNNRINSDEYVRFVNRGQSNVFLSNEWASNSFESLPKELQDNFWALENSGEGIVITGSKPGQTPSPWEEAWLRNVCILTGEAIREVLSKVYAPTKAPTAAPTDSPTGLPSCVPSEAPSTSDVPSDMPSDVPSDVPSDMPSSVPSDIPSDVPSNVPSDAPSDVPSDVPSNVPSDIPSGVPTISSAPSSAPSYIPSASPSRVSSIVPTVTASAVPSAEPTPVTTPEEASQGNRATFRLSFSACATVALYAVY